MREFSALIFSVAAFLLGAELVVHLFPDHAGKLVHGLAVLVVLATVLRGLLGLRLPEIEPVREYGSLSADLETRTADTAALLLRERVAALLKASGVSLSGGENGVLVSAGTDGEGRIAVDGVRVLVRYAEDVPRAEAVMQTVFAGTVSVEVILE